MLFRNPGLGEFPKRETGQFQADMIVVSQIGKMPSRVLRFRFA
jgi:hypothetical protein